MARRFTRIRAKYGEISLIIGLPISVVLLSYLFDRHILTFIPADWSWQYMDERGRFRGASLRDGLALVLGFLTTITLLRSYFRWQRKARRKPEPACPEPELLSVDDLARLRRAQNELEAEAGGLKRLLYRLNWKFMQVERFTKREKHVSWRDFMICVYGSTLALWPASILSIRYLQTDFKDLGGFTVWIWLGLFALFIGIRRMSLG